MAEHHDRRTVLAATLLAVLAGCAAPAAPPPNGPAPGEPADTSGVVPAPSAVRIPALGVSSTLIPLGFTPDGAMAVPPIDQPGQASWFEAGTAGVIPGEVGPAVIAGHVSGRADGRPVPGVFARLTELTVGDLIEVDRHGAPPLSWRVVSVGQYDKAAFPTEAVWGDTAGPELRLVTCGGALAVAGDGTRSYEDNIVVFAVPAP